MRKPILTLLRHGESIWNKENLFTGWTDVDLSDTGRKEAKEAGRLLKEQNIQFSVCYTSYLKRAIHTLNLALEEMEADYLPVNKAWQLNERHYGSLQGLNKAKTAEEFGEEQVKIWRRSFDVKPPVLEQDDSRNPASQLQYQGIDKEQLPLAESLKDTIARVIPYFEENIRPRLLAGENVLIAAHGNSLRALVMYLEQLSEKEITNLNLPTGIPLVYQMDVELNILSKEFLGDSKEVAKKMKKVANQGKAIA